MVETDGISINDLPKACVEDSIAHRNIHPFGKCLKNDECYFKMDLEERWVNVEPQTERVNGKEIITTSSTLICKASGMAIRAVTSGQDGRFARFQQFLRNMERKYPGLRETLEDPYGSVYLEGNYEMALQFLEEQIEGREEGLEIVTLYDPKNLEGAYILAALERLMTDCEVRSFEGFMNDLRDTANQHGMQGKEGWDQNYLNEAMMELLRKDCKETAERIETNPVYRGIEKQKMFGSWLRECMEAFAYTTVMYSSALAEGNSSGRRMEGDKGRGAVKKGEGRGDGEGGSGTKGYSDFADGMSQEDAARYIANNEEKFYSEFSERASKAGLNNTQISEAYNAMKSGDYAKMASYFDTSSSYKGAVFWSGNKTGAGRYATSMGGTLMEQTPGDQVFDNWRGLQGMYNDWGTGTAFDQKPIWEALSSQYANGANGVVTYVHPDGYYGNVWKNTELPILNERLEEGLVNSIQEVIIDGK